MSFTSRIVGTFRDRAGSLGRLVSRDSVSLERAAAKPKASSGPLVPTLPTYLQQQRIGGDISPLVVSNILRDADRGRMARLMDLGNDARQKDNHLQSVLETREGAVPGLDWTLELPPNAKLREKKAALFVEDILRAKGHDLFANQAGATYPGYSVSETIWTKASGFLVPDTFEHVAPRRFNWSANRLYLYDPTGGVSLPGADLLAEYPGHFVVSTPRMNGDVPQREGLLRPLMWAAVFRNWSLADWAKLGEIAWKPWRTASYDREKYASDEDVNGLIRVLDEMSGSGIAVVPNTVDLKVAWPQGTATTAQPHAVLFDTMGAEMSKAVLGQTETTQASKSSGYAQAKVQNVVRKDKVRSDARFVGEDVTRDFIRWAVMLNFGPDVRCPRLRFMTDDPIDIVAFSTGIKNLRDAGTRIPAKWVRAKTGIPEPVKGEEILGPETTDDAEGDASKPTEETPVDKPEDEDDEDDADKA